MPDIAIRKLAVTTHRALKSRAAQNGRSVEAELRHILEESVALKPRLKMGSELEAFGRRFGGIDLDFTRNPSQIEPADFE